MILDCRRMFTNLYICAFVHRHTAQPPAELCDPIKGRSRVSTLSSSPRAKLCSAELDDGQVQDLRLAAAPSLTPLLLSLFHFSSFFTLSLIVSTSLSLYPSSPSLSLSLRLSPPPPPQCPTQQPLFPVLSSYMAAEPWVAVEANGVLRSSEEAEKTRA